MKRESIFKIILITLGTLFGFLIAEIGYRAYHYITWHDLDDIKVDDRPPVIQPDKELTMGQFLQFTPNQKLIYELVPSSSYRFINVPVQTNENGFRDKSYPEQKAEHTFRIIGLGDSNMFGWGVEEKDSYMAQLEGKLNQEDSVHYEIINTAVPGYNTVIEVETLEKKIDLSQVDLVMMNFVPNDFELPTFVRKKPEYLGIKKSFILQLFENTHGKETRLTGSTAEVPEEYMDMVGEEPYVKAMNRLKELAEEHGFQILVFHHSPFVHKVPPIAIKTCEELNIDFLDIVPIWKAYKEEHPEASWRLAHNDWHPTVLAHTFVSDILLEKLRYSPYLLSQ
ncbi:MAG: SGNH/GDSL hydrolase family protein [Bacteroidota bacterium]